MKDEYNSPYMFGKQEYEPPVQYNDTCALTTPELKDMAMMNPGAELL